MVRIAHIDIGLGSPYTLRNGSGPTAPTPTNYEFLVWGDSRTENGASSLNNTNGLQSGTSNLSYISFLEMLSNQRLRFGQNGFFGISASTTYQAAQSPRLTASNTVVAGDYWRTVAGASNKDAQNAEAHPAGIGIYLHGTNDQIVSDAGYLTTSRTNVLYVLNNAPSKVWIILNELPKGIRDNGTFAGQTVTANFKAFSDWLNTLDYASGHANARANVIVVDTWGEFYDETSGTLYRNKAGYSHDGLHLTPYGSRRIAQKIIDRLMSVWPGFAALPSKAVLPTANGFAGMANTAPFLNTNAILTPGTNGAVLGTWGAPPTAATIPQGWTIFISGAGAGVTCVVDKTSFTDPDGFPATRITIGGTLAANATCQVQFYQLINSATLTTLSGQGLFSVNDALRGVARVRTDAGAQCLSSASLSLIMQAITPFTRSQTYYSNRGNTVVNSSAPANRDTWDGEWLTMNTARLEIQDPGKVALGQAISAIIEVSQLQLRVDIDFRNLTAASRSVSGVFYVSRTGIYRATT